MCVCTHIHCIYTHREDIKEKSIFHSVIHFYFYFIGFNKVTKTTANGIENLKIKENIVLEFKNVLKNIIDF